MTVRREPLTRNYQKEANCLQKQLSMFNVPYTLKIENANRLPVSLELQLVCTIILGKSIWLEASVVNPTLPPSSIIGIARSALFGPGNLSFPN